MVLPFWKTVWQFLKLLNLKSPHDPAIPLLHINPNTCACVFATAQLTIAKRGDHPNDHQQVIREQIHIIGSIHTVKYDSAMKRRETLTQATMWMNLEHTILSERSRHRRTHST